MSGLTTDIVNKIITFEEGDLDEGETIALFQGLVDSGLAWKLQGSYGRVADYLIRTGRVTPPKEKQS